MIFKFLLIGGRDVVIVAVVASVVSLLQSTSKLVATVIFGHGDRSQERDA